MSGDLFPGDIARERLDAVRHALLDLHKALLDAERASYEREHGRVSAGELLQLTLRDPHFAWLHPVSSLIVRIDEIFEADEPVPDSEIDGILAGGRRD